MGNLIGFVWIFSKTNYMKALSPIDHFYLKKGANLGFSSNALKYAVKWLVWILEVKRRFFGQKSWVGRHEFELFWPKKRRFTSKIQTSHFTAYFKALEEKPKFAPFFR